MFSLVPIWRQVSMDDKLNIITESGVGAGREEIKY